MLTLAARRLPMAMLLLVVVSGLTFVLVALTPGDPASTILGPYATPDQVAALNRELGFDQPVWQQYWSWLSDALRGDLGTSLVTSQPVTDMLTSRAGVTLSLVVGATLVAGLGGVALGTFSAVAGGARGRVVDAIAMLGFAIPNFWLALVLVDAFALHLRALPATGYVPFVDSPVGWFESLVLPVVTLGAAGVTGVAKQTRDAMNDVLGRDFIDALRADGTPERSIVLRHALRNASIPVVTMVGTFFIGVLGGTVLVESIFALPGLGALLVTSTNSHDLPTIVGIAVFFCVGVVVMNLMVDFAYGYLNPKARVS